jgi:hypothetical protein
MVVKYTDFIMGQEINNIIQGQRRSHEIWTA